MVLQTHAMREITSVVDASILLRDGIRDTPGLELVGDTWLNVIVFTVTKNPDLVGKLQAVLQDAGWHIRALQDPPAIQVCLSNPMAVRVHELMALIREQYSLISKCIHDRRMSSTCSPRCIRQTGEAAQHTSSETANAVSRTLRMNQPRCSQVSIFERYSESTLLGIFGNSCGR